jgi:hemoglobin-like flavoprotein
LYFETDSQYEQGTIKRLFMTPEQIQLVQSTWAVATQSGPEHLGSVFFDRLGQIAPETGACVNGARLAPSYRMLKELRGFTTQLESLSARNQAAQSANAAYSISAQYYFALGNALLWTLEKSLQSKWTEAAEEAWALFVESAVWNLTKKQHLQPAA